MPICHNLMAMSHNLAPICHNSVPLNNNLVPICHNLTTRNENLMLRNENLMPRCQKLMPRNENLVIGNDNLTLERDYEPIRVPLNLPPDLRLDDEAEVCRSLTGDADADFDVGLRIVPVDVEEDGRIRGDSRLGVAGVGRL